MGEFEDKLNSLLSSPKDMEKILGLARELYGSDSKEERDPPPPSETGGFDIPKMDPKLWKVMGRIMGEYSSAKNDKAALIKCMKPYVRDERREALDRALKIAKIVRVARLAFSELGGGDFDFNL